MDLVSTPTAVVREEMAIDEIPRRVGSMFDAVYTALPSSPATQDGQNIAVYAPNGDGRDVVEVGVQVAEPFEGSDALVCSALPSGPALHHRHVGSYALIGRVFTEMYAWAADNDLATTGVGVEVYGDHDPDRPITDLYVMLAS